jgi:type IV secretory pathway VirB10-like protein
VGEHGGAQVVHDTLADLVGDPRLRDADHAVDDRQRDHAAHQPRQQRQLVLDDALVDRFAQQERRGHAEDRAEHDQPQQQSQAQAVGDEQPTDPAQGNVFVGDVLRTELAPSLAPGLKGWALTALTLPSPS